MKTLDLRKKWIQSIGMVDDQFLRMIDTLYTSYINKETDFFDELPKEIQELLLESLEQEKQGDTFSNEEVMTEFKKRFNLAG